jgi:hypothetical protein
MREGGRRKRERVLGKNDLRGYHGRPEPEETTQIAVDDILAFASYRGSILRVLAETKIRSTEVKVRFESRDLAFPAS